MMDLALEEILAEEGVESIEELLEKYEIDVECMYFAPTCKFKR